MNQPAPAARSDRARPSFQALMLGALLAGTFLLGGSARGDVAQLVVLRPLAALALAIGVWTLRADDLRRRRFLFAMAAAIIALPALQLVPLPPRLWMQLPGRDLIAAIDAAAGMGGIWRPLTMTPAETRNALFALLVPAAVLVLGSQLAARELRAMVPVVLALGVVSGVVALMQALGGPGIALYAYPVTNEGSAVGLFANRNHQALLLAMLLPMLGALAALTPKQWPVLRLGLFGAGLIVLPLILITGSRMGLIAGAIALLAVPLVGGLPPAGTGRGAGATRIAVLAGAVVAIVVVGLTVWLDRAVAVQRLTGQDPTADLRTQIWPTLLPLSAAQFPFGSGMGSFERLYQVREPDSLLSPVYMNHAHDDWLELLLNAGLPGALLLAIAVAAFARRAWRTLQLPAGSPARVYGLLGLALIALAAQGSVTDYPLRTPIHAAILALAALWAGARPDDSNETPYSKGLV
jgi:O-antigen ligase